VNKTVANVASQLQVSDSPENNKNSAVQNKEPSKNSKNKERS